MEIKKLLAERGKTHGDYHTHATITQSLKAVIYSAQLRDGCVRLNDSQREAIDMIAHKLGRILAGNPNHRDHWDDIAGYATLVAEQLDVRK